MLAAISRQPQGGSTPRSPTVRILGAIALIGLGRAAAGAAEPVALGGQRVLFVDDTLTERSAGLERRLHPPRPRETVLTFDAPWEGSGSDFERLIRDGDTIRLYYMGTELTADDGTKFVHGPVRACYAESKDGIHWMKPDLGIVPFQGNTHNNIIWAEPHLDNVTPFRDTNPACLPDERYKATCSPGNGLLFALKSPDGIHWSRLTEAPIMTHGQFDTQNDAFWDAGRRCYWCYIRGFHSPVGQSIPEAQRVTHGIRDIRVATSTDFRHWSEPQRLDFGAAPDEALYTSQVELYDRVPGLFLGFPTRYVDRAFSAAALRALPDPVHRQRRMGYSPRYGSVVTDGQFMFSRDGFHFQRWDESFIPPGPERSNNWVYGDGYQSLGLIETPAEDPTAGSELSCYVDEGHWKDGETLRRYTLRLDGFVSLHASRAGGELVTRALVFSGGKLSLNFATAAAGALGVEVLEADGERVLARSEELFGDRPDRTVAWQGGAALASLAGRPVRLRLALREADLYSLRFEP